MQKKRNIKNIILKSITWVAALLFVINGCALDSDSWIPTIVVGICILWFWVFALCNNYFERCEK